MYKQDQLPRTPKAGGRNSPDDAAQSAPDSQRLGIGGKLDVPVIGGTYPFGGLLNASPGGYFGSVPARGAPVRDAVDSQEQVYGLAQKLDMPVAGGAYPLGGSQTGAAGGYGGGETGSLGDPPVRDGTPLSRPLRVIHVGQHMVRAGIEMWLKALVKYSDPNCLRFERCIVTSTYNDPQVIRELPVPVEVGGEASVRRAATDCDVLLVSGPGELTEWLGKLRPPLCVFVAHGDGIFTRKILGQCAPVVDHVVAVSHRVQREVCQAFPNTVIYNGIDTAHLTRSAQRDEIRERFGFVPEDFVLGSVMRLSPEKHPELLIEAVGKLPRKFKLLLVGWGPLQQKLFDLANRIAPLRCVITQANGHLGDYYRAFDTFCLPSETEGFGLATLEALFCGVPVVTTDCGFAPELLRDRVQFLQCAGNSDAIAQSLATLAAHPQWAAGLAEEGRLAAEQFGFAGRMCREYESLLRRLWAVAKK